MTIRQSVHGTLCLDDVAALQRPIAWSGTMPEKERRQQEAELRGLVEELRGLLSWATEVHVEHGRIVSVS